MRVTKRLLLLPCVVALVATACGALGGVTFEPGGGRSLVQTPSTVRVGPQDARRTVSVQVGDRLVVLLEPSRSARWRLLRYPGGVLSLAASDDGEGRYEFVARAAGRGHIWVAGLHRCGPPIPRGSPEGVGCPVAAEAPGRFVPHWLFTVTIRVVG